MTFPSMHLVVCRGGFAICNGNQCMPLPLPMPFFMNSLVPYTREYSSSINTNKRTWFNFSRPGPT